MASPKENICLSFQVSTQFITTQAIQSNQGAEEWTSAEELSENVPNNGIIFILLHFVTVG
jgi:hypothetical protein